MDFLVEELEPEVTAHPSLSKWKILIVDDEDAIHQVTRLAMEDLKFEGRSVDFLSAYSGEEARKILLECDDIAIVLLDVVMETDDEGLRVAKWMREVLGNELVRIVLRTGQPGHAPERKVIIDYDIYDYKNKSELTTQKLFTCLITGLRSYRDMKALWQNREGLKRVIEGSTYIFKERYLKEFTIGALQQLTSLLHLESDAALMTAKIIAAHESNHELKVIAATGTYEQHIGEHPSSVLSKNIIDRWLSSTDNMLNIGESEIIVSFIAGKDSRSLLYLQSSVALSPDSIKLIELFTKNLSIAHKNLALNLDAENTQRELISLLCGAVETRSKETANHIIRVAEISALLAEKLGFSHEDINELKLASPLHDLGKVGIPDAILNKPGKHTGEEWQVMKTHAELGQQLLSQSERPIIKSGAIIAGQHHEKWDGSGYPNGLAGEDIHIYGRITALADVFDALCSKRCYKEAWSVEDTVALIHDESGKHFDPKLVKILEENLADIIKIQKQHPDN